MADSSDLLCLFSAEIEADDDSYTIEVPKREVELGGMRSGGTYRIAVLPRSDTNAGGESGGGAKAETGSGRPEMDAPPVEEGEVVDLEIEDLGEKGDGIARVGPGYVIIVNDAALGERVAAEITEVRDTLAFADVVNHYDRP